LTARELRAFSYSEIHLQLLGGDKAFTSVLSRKKTSTRVRYQKAELKLENPPAVARVRASTTRRGPVAHLECAAACSSCRGAPGWPENDPGKGSETATERNGQRGKAETVRFIGSFRFQTVPI